MKQHTFKRAITIAGLGLHTGERVSIRLLPAPVDHGIVFVRTDIANFPRVAVGQAWICDTLLCTGIEQHGARVRTVEHLLAALSSTGIDNAIIEIDAQEIPILDGSSAPWLHLIAEAGVEQQDAWRKALEVVKPFSIDIGSSWIRVQPETSFRRRIRIDFDHPCIDRTPMVAQTQGDSDYFIRHTGRARTFGFLHQVEQMHANGLARGGSLDNAMVLDQHHLINEDGMRMDDEFAQHKLLDLIGDLAILGAPLIGFVDAYRPGHSVQASMTNTLRQRRDITRWVRITDDGLVPEGTPLHERDVDLLDGTPIRC